MSAHVVLESLRRDGPATVRDLAEDRLVISETAIRQALAVLEAAGAVERLPREATGHRGPPAARWRVVRDRRRT